MSVKSIKSIFFNLCSVICVLSSFLIAGCVSTEEVGMMRWELNELRSEVKKIRKTSKSIETQFPGQQKQIDKKLKELEAAQKATAGTVSDLLVNVQSLTSEFRILTGRFDEARYFSEKTSAGLLENKDMLIAKVTELELAIEDLKKKLSEPAAEGDDTKKKEDKKTEETEKAKEDIKEESKKPEKAGTEEAQKIEVKDAYMAAYQAYKEGRPEEARERFMSVLSDYPENDYSDNARFWIAESYYKEGSYEDAILAYEELFKKNPESDKVPGALLKQGLSFYALKDKKTGGIILEKLIEKFPDSEQARLARKKLRKTVPPKKKN
ncbi:MAG TPA: tol-pal system protein YbgF [Nitrospirae bacterium]|nr:tol-pal system protein YbgF [bacterium BMS3Abin06]HDH12972.1 tol-pal system protein YbgF [Nitrospirota bacterium]HDZ02967.1 tol-pal system protein YbgF [Nitrospirota bacterium]